MQISRAIDISLRALIVLAEQSDRLTTVDRLASVLGVPTRYLGKTIQRLAAEGWVETARGKGGGIRVSDAGRALTVAQVIRTLDEGRSVVNCLEPPCPLLEAGCPLRHSLAQAEAAFMEPLAAVRVADLGRSVPAEPPSEPQQAHLRVNAQQWVGLPSRKEAGVVR